MMLLRHRGMLTLITLATLACASISGAAWMWSVPVDPETASRPQLLRTLVLQEMQLLPETEQHAWVERVQAEMAGEFDVRDAQQLTSPQRQQLARNVATLQKTWFTLRCAQYADLPKDERPAFLRRQLALVQAWPKMASLAHESTAPEVIDSAALISQIDAWIAAAQEPQRGEMIAAVQDGVLLWLATSDLAEQSPQVQSDLAERFAKSLESGNAMQNLPTFSDPSEQRQFHHNAEVLLQAYIQSRAAEFAHVPSEQRVAWLDHELDALNASDFTSLLTKLSPPADTSRSDYLRLADQMQVWIDNSPREQRAQVAALVNSVQQRIVWRQLPQWMRK